MKTMRGFTLIEVMIALAMFSILLTAIYQTYYNQQEAYLKQEKVSNMQQDVRTGGFFLARDLRMAGYDPTTQATGAGFTDRGLTSPRKPVAALEIRADLNSDNDSQDTGEIIYFELSNDADYDGIADGINRSGGWKSDGSPCRLTRQYRLALDETSDTFTDSTTGSQVLAENVDALEFCYVLNTGIETIAPTSGELDDIVAIYVSILFRTKARIPKYRNTETYTPASADSNRVANLRESTPSPWGPFDDSFKRRLLITEVKCRNIGLKPIGSGI